MRVEQLIVLLALSWCVTSRANDDDDDAGRPYEFGFTIDGEQHRHEAKDVNGIINGEFGFITADGVYHVTVYATDENGSFKILSMKNVKISDPLDQPGFEFPNRTPTGVSQPAAPGHRPSAVPPARTTTLRPQAPYEFTTVPSLNVAACSSCKLPSTTRRPAGAPNGLPFQTPAFQNPPQINGNQQIFIENGRQPPAAVNQPGFPRNPSTGNQPDRPATNHPPGLTQSSVPHSNQFVKPPVGNLPVTSNTIGNDGPPQKPSGEQQPPYGQPGTNNQPSRGNPSLPPSPFPPLPTNPNQPTLGLVQRPFKPSQSVPNSNPITVSNQQINIPGHDPIPITDPYPNMQDGLPAGITEHDMLDLLYKFNYTLGFHGHHERGLKNGTKIGAYFVNGRDGISRVVEYVADEYGYRPKFRFVNLGLDSSDTPKEGSEKKFGLKGFEFVWFPI